LLDRVNTTTFANSCLILSYVCRIFSRPYLMGCLHDLANVQQTSSKCIQNTRANAGRLLDVCWIV